MRVHTGAAAVAAFVLTAGASGFCAWKREPVAPNDGVVTRDSDEVGSSTPFRLDSQLVLLYVGRRSCRWCTSPEMHQALDSIRSLTATHASRNGVRLRTYGIGLDADPTVGLSHLKDVGGFDAVSAGDGWLGIGGGQLAWGALAGPRATPQIIVLGRLIRAAGTPAAGFVEVLEERLLVRKIGLDEIQEWLFAGAPIGAIIGSVDDQGK